ncbi:MAG: nucleoside hydrolase, partial [Pararhodobacter sp.]
MKVIIDTDPGLDDAVAILYALAEPGFQVQAITSVAGNIGLARTTENAGRLLAVTGARVPVVTGAERPLSGPGRNEAAIHGEDGLGGVVLPEPLAPPLPDAVRFMAGMLLEAPEGSLHILALAPLTNLALLARDHPAAF